MESSPLGHPQRFYEFWQHTKFKSSRDFVFDMVLQGFAKSPIRVLNIGGIRMTAETSWERYSDGLSPMFFADYILKNGGSLHIVDICPETIENTKKVMEWFNDKIDIHYHVCSGEDVLRKDAGFSFVYLDGGNDPAEMVAEYSLCPKSTVILCDDWTLKGVSLHHVDPNYVFFKFSEGHTMSLYHPNAQPTTVNIQDTEDCILWQRYVYYHNFDQPNLKYEGK